jgi:hypothetical protein
MLDERHFGEKSNGYLQFNFGVLYIVYKLVRLVRRVQHDSERFTFFIMIINNTTLLYERSWFSMINRTYLSYRPA